MSISVVRLGNGRSKGEGIRIGTVRLPPRGVHKADYARLNYYDVWLPQLAPSRKLLAWVMDNPDTPENWKLFTQKYQNELREGDNSRLVELLAKLSKKVNFSIGCYCEAGDRCHRSILAKVLNKQGALLKKLSKYRE
jgi:uncharacterized protein YeaO (DUF488 family)